MREVSSRAASRIGRPGVKDWRRRRAAPRRPAPAASRGRTRSPRPARGSRRRSSTARISSHGGVRSAGGGSGKLTSTAARTSMSKRGVRLVDAIDVDVVAEMVDMLDRQRRHADWSSMPIEVTFWPGNCARAQMGDVVRRVDAAGVGVGGAMREQVLHRQPPPSSRRGTDGLRRRHVAEIGAGDRLGELLEPVLGHRSRCRAAWPAPAPRGATTCSSPANWRTAASRSCVERVREAPARARPRRARDSRGGRRWRAAGRRASAGCCRRASTRSSTGAGWSWPR